MLGAGTGQRLRPLSLLRPKVLCPVADRPLVDWAIERVRGVTPDVAVNVHHHRQAKEAHLAGRVHLSVEAERPLGTAGGLAQLRGWLDGRAALVVNGDTWCPAPLSRLLEGWDGERVRVLVRGRSPLGANSRVIGSLHPWAVLAGLRAEPAGLWERVWRTGVQDGRLESLGWEGPFADCASPADYLAANLTALDWLDESSGRRAGGCAGVGAGVGEGGRVERSVIGAGARVEGSVRRVVVWPRCVVGPGEHLVDAIRADDGVTVLIR